MKKIFAFIALVAIFLGIGYGVYFFTGDNTILALVLTCLGCIAAVFVLGLIFWLFEYLLKN